MKRPVLAGVGYVSGVVAANVLTEHLGLVAVGFGLTATAGTYAAAFVLVCRNIAQDQLGRGGVIVLMLIGAVLSWWLASPELALASTFAFALSESADMAIYTPLRRKGRSRAVAVASSLGGLVDTVAFLAVAGFPIWSSLPGQLFVKVGMAMVAALVLRGCSALLRQPVRAERGASHA